MLEFITRYIRRIVDEFDFRWLVALVVRSGYVASSILFNHHFLGFVLDERREPCYLSTFALTIIDQLHFTITASHNARRIDFPGFHQVSTGAVGTTLSQFHVVIIARTTICM